MHQDTDAPFEERVIAVQEEPNLQALSCMRDVPVECVTLELPVHVVSRVSRSQLRRNLEHSTACFWIEFPRIRMMTSTTKR